MGGINPPAPTQELLAQTQEFTRALCCINSTFWNAHSEIEMAVLAEGQNNEVADSHLYQAVRDIHYAADAVEDARKVCSAALTNLGEIRFSGDMLTPYFYSQLPPLVALSSGLLELGKNMDPEILRANSTGTLQDGLFFDRENSNVRRLSLYVIEALSHLNAEHMRLVKSTNEVLAVAA